jgi:hypothetical protein
MEGVEERRKERDVDVFYRREEEEEKEEEGHLL